MPDALDSPQGRKQRDALWRLVPARLYARAREDATDQWPRKPDGAAILRNLIPSEPLAAPLPAGPPGASHRAVRATFPAWTNREVARAHQGWTLGSTSAHAAEVRRSMTERSRRGFRRALHRRRPSPFALRLPRVARAYELQ